MAREKYCPVCGQILDWYGAPNEDEIGYCPEHGAVEVNDEDGE